MKKHDFWKLLKMELSVFANKLFIFKNGMDSWNLFLHDTASSPLGVSKSKTTYKI